MHKLIKKQINLKVGVFLEINQTINKFYQKRRELKKIRCYKVFNKVLDLNNDIILDNYLNLKFLIQNH